MRDLDRAVEAEVEGGAVGAAIRVERPAGAWQGYAVEPVRSAGGAVQLAQFGGDACQTALQECDPLVPGLPLGGRQQRAAMGYQLVQIAGDVRARRRLHRLERCLQAVVLALGDRIELVIVAAGAVHGQSEERLADDSQHFLEIVFADRFAFPCYG